MRSISRRQFIRVSTAVAAASVLTACAKDGGAVAEVDPTSPPVLATTNPVVPSPAPTRAPDATAVPTKAPEPTTAPVEVEPAEFRFIGSEIGTLDSYLYTNGMYAQVYLGFSEGLVQFDRNLGVALCQAESYSISDDGLEYTFYLRPDNVWYDGTPVTAQDYVTTIEYSCKPDQNTKYGWDSPFGYLAGVEEYRSGAAGIEDVGVEALDDYTLKYTLRQPVPDFLNALVTGSCFPIQTANYQANGDDWHQIENFQGNGPYMPADWTLTETISAVPNPLYNLERGNLTKVIMPFAGKPLEAYEAGETDFGGVANIAELTVALNDPVLSKELNQVATSGLEWLAPVNSEDGFLYDHPKVFLAIVKAVDVAKLVDPIFLGTRAVTTQMYPQAQPGCCSDYDDVLAPDPDAARTILAEAGFPDGVGVPTLKLHFPSYQNEDYVSSWTAIAAEITEQLGINVVLNNLETGIYSQIVYDRLNPAEEAGVGFYASGKPWGTPVFGTQFDFKREFADSATYSEWAKMMKLQSEVSQRLVEVEGGDDTDFANAIVSLEDFRALELAELASRDALDLQVASTQKVYDGWMESVTDTLSAIKSGDKDRDEAWAEVKSKLIGAEARVFRTVNLRDEVFQYEKYRVEARQVTDVDEQIAISLKGYEMVLNDMAYFPLWLSVSSTLTRPYVKGLQQNPFWWGNIMYMKWISIEK